MTITTGQVVTMRLLRDRRELPNGKLRSEITYRAPKGELFVCLFLGTVASGKEGEIDADAILQELGWTFSPAELAAPSESSAAAPTP